MVTAIAVMVVVLVERKGLVVAMLWVMVVL